MLDLSNDLMNLITDENILEKVSLPAGKLFLVEGKAGDELNDAGWANLILKAGDGTTKSIKRSTIKNSKITVRHQEGMAHPNDGFITDLWLEDSQLWFADWDGFETRLDPVDFSVLEQVFQK